MLSPEQIEAYRSKYFGGQGGTATGGGKQQSLADKISAFKQEQAQSQTTLGKVNTGLEKAAEFTNKIPVVKQLSDFGKGVSTAIGEGGLGLAQTALKINKYTNPIQWAIDKFAPKEVSSDALSQNIETLKEKVYREPNQASLDTMSGKLGEVTGEVAQFLAPSGAIAKTGQAAQEAYKASGFAKKLADSGFVGKVTDYVSKKGIQGLNEFLGTTLTELGLDGMEDVSGAVKTGAGAGIFSGLTHVGSDAYRKLIPQTVKDNVLGAFKFSGKQSLSSAGGKLVDDYVEGLQTIANNAPNIKVLDIDGVEKVFDPKKATFMELPQALDQTKTKLYEKWMDMAKQAGDKGIQFTRADFGAVADELKKYSGKGYTPAFTNKANQIKEALARFQTTKNGVTYLEPAEFTEMLELVKNLNKDINPVSDAAGSVVAQKTSQVMRDIIDNKITKSGLGGDFQKTRDAFTQLKTMENDVMNQWKKALRSANVQPGVIDGVITLDGLLGILTANPSQMMRAGTGGIVRATLGYLNDPNVKLQRAFELMTSKPKVPSAAGQRFLGK